MFFNTKNHPLKLFFMLVAVTALLSACATSKPIPLFKAPANASEQEAQKNQQNTAILSVPIEIDLVYADGQRKSFSPAYQPYIAFALLPGKHALGFRYQDMVLNEDGNRETITSETVIIRFTAKSGGKYIIDFTKPTSFSAALKLEKTFKLSLSEQHVGEGTDVGLSKNKVENKGEKEIEKTVGQKGKKTLLAHSFPAPQAPAANWLGSQLFTAEAENLFSDEMQTSLSEKPAANAPASAQLIYWWKKASEKEQSDFKAWLNNSQNEER